MTKNTFLKTKNDYLSKIQYEAHRDVSSQVFVSHMLKLHDADYSHFHHAVEVIYIKKGGLHALKGMDEVIEAGEGDFLLFDRMTVHRTDHVQNGDYYLIIIPDKFLGKMDSMRGDRQLRGTVCRGVESDLLPMLCEELSLAAKNRAQIGSTAYIQAMVNTLLIGLCELIGFEEAQASENELVLPMIAYMIDHLSENLTIREVAARFGYTPRGFTKMFERIAKISLKEFMAGIKLENARLLLENEKMTLETVAEKSGYGCLRSFHRAFLDGTGMTPGEYRKLIKTDSSRA